MKHNESIERPSGSSEFFPWQFSLPQSPMTDKGYAKYFAKRSYLWEITAFYNEAPAHPCSVIQLENVHWLFETNVSQVLFMFGPTWVNSSLWEVEMMLFHVDKKQLHFYIPVWYPVWNRRKFTWQRIVQNFSHCSKFRKTSKKFESLRRPNVRRQNVRGQETKTGHFEHFQSYDEVARARKASFTMPALLGSSPPSCCFFNLTLFFRCDSLTAKNLSDCHPRLACLRSPKCAYGSDHRERVRLDPQILWTTWNMNLLWIHHFNCYVITLLVYGCWMLSSRYFVRVPAVEFCFCPWKSFQVNLSHFWNSLCGKELKIKLRKIR